MILSLNWKNFLFGLSVATLAIGLVEMVLRIAGINRSYSEMLQKNKATPLKFAAVMAKHRWEPDAGNNEHGELNLFPGKQIPDPELFWMLEPGSSYRPDLLPSEGRSIRRNDQPAEEKINRLGWRDDEVPETKSPDAYRVFCIGDSMTFGLGVYRSETYSEVLENLLNDAKPSIQTEVYNAGTPGYTSYQSRKLFETKILNLKPDAVTVMIGINDSDAKRNITDFDYAKLVRPGRINDIHEFFLSRSRIFVSLHKFILWANQRKNEKQSVPRVTQEQFQQNLSSIASDCSKKSIKLIVIKEAFRNQSSTDHVRSLDSLTASLQIPPLDMHAALDTDLASRRTADLDWDWDDYFTDPIHPSADGHAVIAEGLYEIMSGFFPYNP